MVGVLDILQDVGVPRVVGSVDLDLMTWRDIDIWLSLELKDKQRFIDLGSKISQRLMASGFAVVRLSFNDEYLRPGNPYGSGLYWSFQFLPVVGDEEAWKVDVWGYDPVTYAEKLADYEKLKAGLCAADRSLILGVKSAVYKLPEYRKTITSADIYEFALAGAGSTVEDFKDFLDRRASRR